MAAIRALLNPTSSTSESSDNRHGIHDRSYESAHDPYDRAQEIGRHTAREMTPVPSSKRLASPITSTADIHYRRFISPSPTPTQVLSRSASPAMSDMIMQSPRKKPKIVKDAPVFTRGPTRGEVRYPPYIYATGEKLAGVSDKKRSEELINKLQEYHDQFEVYPRQEEVGDYPRFIPYNSERRIFADATGRDFFEVFQYEFRVAGREEKPYTVLWDYNVGLVRTTPLFKCCGYGKTTPAKMLNRNVGLREICHSITGGALVAQGYWMPYEAAKAVAATFCWSIRYALTPVFGIDFIDMCIPPDSDKFGVMLIDPKITKLCTEQARQYKQREFEHPHNRPVSGLPSPRTPQTSTFHRPIIVPTPRFKAINVNASGASSSGYSTEGSDDGYVMSPASPNGMCFRQIGWRDRPVPRSAPRARLSTTPSPKSLVPRVKLRRDRDDDEEYEGRASKRSSPSSPAVSLRERNKDIRMMGMDDDAEGEYDGDVEMKEVSSMRYHGGHGVKGVDNVDVEVQGGMGNQFGPKDAAKALLSLWGVRKVPKRRASA